MAKNRIAKDFLLKSLFPVLIAWFLFAMFKNVFTKDGATDYFMVWIMCGIPFGIRRMYLWLVPHSQSSLQFTIGLWALDFIVGGLIGGTVLVWRLLCAAWYFILTIYRLFTYKKQIPAENASVI